MRLTDFKVLSFDCYGTLIDWETGIIEALGPLSGRATRKLSRNDILEAHAHHEGEQQRQTPAMAYRNLLPIVFKRLAEQWGVAVSHEECAAYGRSVGTWPAFADTVSALHYLKRFYRLVILSNVDNESFDRTKRRLQVAFDAVITAEDAGSYKPDLRNFEYMMTRLSAGLDGTPIAKGDILHTAQSLFHDHRPAKAFGLATCWIDRRHQDVGFGATSDPGEIPRVDMRFTSMAELAEAHRDQLAQLR